MSSVPKAVIDALNMELSNLTYLKNELNLKISHKQSHISNVVSDYIRNKKELTEINDRIDQITIYLKEAECK